MGNAVVKGLRECTKAVEKEHHELISPGEIILLSSSHLGMTIYLVEARIIIMVQKAYQLELNNSLVYVRCCHGPNVKEGATEEWASLVALHLSAEDESWLMSQDLRQGFLSYLENITK